MAVETPGRGFDTELTVPRRGRWEALDGLRGLAVAAVLLFHGGFAWASGGFLGVSTFFTLSGFLITTLLLDGPRSAHGTGLADFWRRRSRRLVPGGLVALGIVVSYGVLVANGDQQRMLFGDMVGAVTATINWRFIIAGQNYAQLFTAPSPLQHFWSLAIECQFYLLFPFLAVAALGRRRAVGRLAWVVVTAMAASLAITLFAGFSDDRTFYGTDTRVFELLAGAALALVVDALSRRRHRTTAAGAARASALLGIAGVIGLAGIVVLWWRTTLGSNWIYHGGLPAYSLLSAVVVAALVLAPTAAITRALSARPIQAVGVISYGLYLFHWPIFLWLTPARTHLAVWPNFALRIAVTTAVAYTSWRLVEEPVRTRQWRARPYVLPATAGGLAALFLTCSLLITTDAPLPPTDFAAAERALAQPTTDGPVDPTLATVGWFGDSTALVLAEGATYDTGTSMPITNRGGAAELGCGIAQGGKRRQADGTSFVVDADCAGQRDRYRQFIASNHPDLAVVLYGPNDLYDVKIPGVCESWCHIGSEPYDQYLHEQMLDTIDALSSDGTQVVWLTTPPQPVPDQRTDTFNDMIRRLPDDRPGQVTVIDLDSYLRGTGKDAELRPDGVHLSNAAAVQIGQGWLDPQLASIQAHRRTPPGG